MLLFVISCSSKKDKVITQKIINNIECIEENLDSIFPEKYTVYEIGIFSEHKNFQVLKVTPRINSYNPTIKDKIGFENKSFQFDLYEKDESLFLVKSKNAILTEKNVALLAKYHMIDSSFVNIDPETHLFNLQFGADSLKGVDYDKLPQYIIDERIFTAYFKIYDNCNIVILGPSSSY